MALSRRWGESSNACGSGVLAVESRGYADFGVARDAAKQGSIVKRSESGSKRRLVMGYESEQYELLSAYLDGELSATERVEVEQLLSRDPDARAQLERLRATARLVGSLPRGRAPSDLAERVLAQLERESLLESPAAKVVKLGRRLRWLAVAAALALVVTASWLVLPSWRSEKATSGTLTLAQREPTADRLAYDDELGRDLEHTEEASPKAASLKSGKDSRDALAKPATGGSEPLAASGGSRGTPSVPALAAGPTGTKSKETPTSPTASPPASETTLVFADRPSKEEASRLGGGSGSKGEAAGIPAAAPASAKRAEPELRGGENKSAGEENVAEAEQAGELMYGHRFEADQVWREAGKDKAVSEPSGSFETLLRANVLANADLPRVPAEAVRNQIVVDTDLATQTRLVNHIENFMASANVPDARVQQLAEPITPTQTFYLVQSVPAGQPPVAAPTAAHPATKQAVPKQEAGRNVEILMNMRREQVPELVAALEEASRNDQARTSWTANSVLVGGGDFKRQLTNQLAGGGELGLDRSVERLRNATKAARQPAETAESRPASAPLAPPRQSDQAEYVALSILVRGRALSQAAAAAQGPPEPTTQRNIAPASELAPPP